MKVGQRNVVPSENEDTKEFWMAKDYGAYPFTELGRLKGQINQYCVLLHLKVSTSVGTQLLLSGQSNDVYIRSYSSTKELADFVKIFPS